jgi:hypothetical protein
LPLSQLSASIFSVLAGRNLAYNHKVAAAVATATITTTNDNQAAAAVSSQFSPSLLTVRAEDLHGYKLLGIPIVFSHQGNVIIKDTPATISIPSNIHNYTVSSPDSFFRNYANATFNHWKQDKDNDRTKTISIFSNDGGGSSNVENLTAVYRFYPSNCSSCIPGTHPPGLAPGLEIKIVDSEGNLIKGVKVTFSYQNGTFVRSGISSLASPIPYFFGLRNETTYVVSLPTTFVGNNSNVGNISDSSKTYYHFSHWQGIDGYYQNRDTSSILLTQISNNWDLTWYEVRLTAVYSKE